MTSAAAAAAAEETILSEVVAASLGGAISATLLYPLEVLKCKMQAVDNNDNDNDDSASKSNTTNSQKMTKQPPLSMLAFARNMYRTEGGASVFWRGVETSALQSALEKALYFFAYTGLKECYTAFQRTTTPTTTKPPPLSAGMNLILGCLAEWAHLPITLPVDAWTTRIQTQSSHSSSKTTNNKTTNSNAPLQILLAMLQDKDCRMYKGIGAYALLCFKPAIQYTVYEQVKAALLLSRQQRQQNHSSSSNTSLSALEAFALGMMARVVATVLVFPFLRAKVLLQTSKPTSNKSNDTSAAAAKGASSPADSDPRKNDTNNNNNTIRVLREQWQNAGFAGLYQGIGPELTRGIFSAALMLMIKERIAVLVRERLLRRQ